MRRTNTRTQLWTTHPRKQSKPMQNSPEKNHKPEAQTMLSFLQHLLDSKCQFHNKCTGYRSANKTCNANMGAGCGTHRKLKAQEANRHAK
jgi:hypothetical protein